MPGKSKKGGGLETKSYAPFKMKMKSYGQGKSPLEMNSPAKGLFGKILGGAKDAISGKGALGAVINPVGAIASKGKGLFMKEKYNKKQGKTLDQVNY